MSGLPELFGKDPLKSRIFNIGAGVRTVQGSSRAGQACLDTGATRERVEVQRETGQMPDGLADQQITSKDQTSLRTPSSANERVGQQQSTKCLARGESWSDADADADA
ncbi:hypothetical protein HYALB_00001704 [Hymenoscyphus albidus]|uniref:Uncharacterized protein n=1 Tax=Hymenoscyphus albidus TaxID=595503 RepID=A0A9N9LEJ4_9HELO|nr:hypothetical protein HYALB_00001704 [Hymenoscyphus albidus]